MQFAAGASLAAALFMSAPAIAESLRADEVYSSIAVTAISDPDPVRGEGVHGSPFVLSEFGSPGTLPAAEEDNLFAGQTVTLDPALDGAHARRLPLNAQVVDFE